MLHNFKLFLFFVLLIVGVKCLDLSELPEGCDKPSDGPACANNPNARCNDKNLCTDPTYGAMTRSVCQVLCKSCNAKK
ncbi:hypothetical protein M3Y96_01057200 [Aphelenchoides besseyi]|nr:hypothetical protein M3Y96_01057200 [Aphelenchoides besseyi]